MTRIHDSSFRQFKVGLNCSSVCVSHVGSSALPSPPQSTKACTTRGPSSSQTCSTIIHLPATSNHLIPPFSLHTKHRLADDQNRDPSSRVVAAHSHWGRLYLLGYCKCLSQCYKKLRSLLNVCSHVSLKDQSECHGCMINVVQGVLQQKQTDVCEFQTLSLSFDATLPKELPVYC